MSGGVVYLTVDFTAAVGTQTTATIERGTSATGPWTFLATVDLLGEVGVYYDTTAPLDTAIWYRWTGDPGGDEIIQGPYLEPGDGTVLLKDPLRPWANLSFAFCATAQQALSSLCAQVGPELIWVGFGEFVRQADANLFNVYNAEKPADIYGRRKRLNGSLTLFSKTLAAAEAVETLFTAGGPLQLQMPAVYGWPDAVIQPGDLTENYRHPDQRRPYRVWDAPFTIVDTPLGPHQGTVDANWCALEDNFPTFAHLTASGLTWAQVAAGAGSGNPPDEDGFGLGPYGSGPYGDGG